MYPGGAYRVSIGLFLQLLVINALEIAPGPSSWDEKLTYLETSLNDMTFINQYVLSQFMFEVSVLT